MGQGAQGRVVRQGLPEGAEGGPDAGVGGGQGVVAASGVGAVALAIG